MWVGYLQQKWKIILCLCSKVHHGLACLLLGGLGHQTEAIVFQAGLYITWHLLEALVSLKLSTSELHGKLLVGLEHLPEFLELILGQFASWITVDQVVDGAGDHEVEDVQR